MKTSLTSTQQSAFRGLFFSLALVLVYVWAMFVVGCQTPPKQPLDPDAIPVYRPEKPIVYPVPRYVCGCETGL